jgi:hypothetical protein
MNISWFRVIKRTRYRSLSEDEEATPLGTNTWKISSNFSFSGDCIAASLATSVIVTHTIWYTVRFFTRSKESVVVNLTDNRACSLVIDSFRAFGLSLQVLLHVIARDNWSLSALIIWPDYSSFALAMTMPDFWRTDLVLRYNYLWLLYLVNKAWLKINAHSLVRISLVVAHLSDLFASKWHPMIIMHSYTVAIRVSLVFALRHFKSSRMRS